MLRRGVWASAPARRCAGWPTTRRTRTVGSVITDEEIRALARLARLRVPDADVPALRDELERILGYVRGLAEVSVDGVEPFVGPRDEPVRLRTDEPSDAMDRELALRAAARHDDVHVLVPRFVDEG